jgi:hypothetical protein
MVVVIGVVLEAHQRLRKLIMLFVKEDEIYEQKTNVFVMSRLGQTKTEMRHCIGDSNYKNCIN